MKQKNNMKLDKDFDAEESDVQTGEEIDKETDEAITNVLHGGPTNNKKPDVVETTAEVIDDVSKLEEAKKIMSANKTKIHKKEIFKGKVPDGKIWEPKGIDKKGRLVIEERPLEPPKEEKVPQTPPKEEKIKVTIIIQNKNYAHYLRKTILSCIIQDFPKDQYEIIGYDANSDDKSMEVYNRFKDRIRIVEVGDKWQATALNEVIKKYAKGKYIAIINSDDWLLSNFLKKHINAFNEAPEDVVITYSNAYRQYENGERTVYTPKDKDKKLIPKKEIINVNFIFQPSVMIRKSSLEKIGYFDEKLKHSWDYKAWIELSKIGKFGYVDSVTTVYRLHSKMGTVIMRDEAVKDTIRILAPKGVHTKEDKEKLKKRLKDTFGMSDKEVEGYVK